jgi:hypothetical protein
MQINGARYTSKFTGQGSASWFYAGAFQIEADGRGMLPVACGLWLVACSSFVFRLSLDSRLEIRD